MLKWLLVILTTNANGFNVEIRSDYASQAKCVEAKKVATLQPQNADDFDRSLYCIKNYK